MKDLLLKVVNNKGVRQAFVGLMIAIAVALGFMQAGCASLQSDPRVAAALCAVDAVDELDPETLTLGEARDLVAELQDCRHAGAGPDAGTAE